MRVISGLRRGHKLNSPKGMDVRPTEDKVKESLFNILGTIDNDSIVLDLFAGSGSIGIEFLSRGAKESFFVDISSKSIETIRSNLLHTKFVEASTVLKSDALRAIRNLKSKGLKFDYIYVDPPFKDRELLDGVFKSLSENPLIKDDGLLIVEHDSQLILEDEIVNFKKIDERRYGSKIITFFRTIL